MIPPRPILKIPVKSYAAVAEALSAQDGRKISVAEIRQIEARAILKVKDALTRRGESFRSLLELSHRTAD